MYHVTPNLPNITDTTLIGAAHARPLLVHTLRVPIHMGTPAEVRPHTSNYGACAGPAPGSVSRKFLLCKAPPGRNHHRATVCFHRRQWLSPRRYHSARL